MPEKVTPSESTTVPQLTLSPTFSVNWNQLIVWRKKAWRVLSNHWVLLYPMLLFSVLQDLMGPSVFAAIKTPDLRFFLLLGMEGLVWVVFFTGLLGMVFRALDEHRDDLLDGALTEEQKATSAAARAFGIEGDIKGQATSDKQPELSQLPLFQLWGAFLDAIGTHFFAMVFGWAIFLGGVLSIVWMTHSFVLAQGGYPEVVLEGLRYLSHLDASTIDPESFQEQSLKVLSSLTPQQSQVIDTLATRLLSGVFALGVFIMFTLFWAPTVIRHQASVLQAYSLSVRLFLQTPFFWMLIGVLFYVAMVSVQVLGLLHPILMIIQWFVLMVLQVMAVLIVCQVVDTCLVRKSESLSHPLSEEPLEPLTDESTSHG